MGVRLSIEELAQDEIYDLLLQLPSLDPRGLCAKSLHRALVNRPDDGSGTDTPTKLKFLREGSLWGEVGSIGGYHRVSRLYYVGTNVVPQVIARKVPRLELDKKQGGPKVQRMFGVQSLDPGKWKVEVTSSALNEASDRFNQELEHLKPYIYAVRLFSDTSPTGLQKLKNLHFHLCTRVEGIAAVDGSSEIFSLEEHSELVMNNTDVFILTQAGAHEPPLQDVVLMDAIGEVFAEVLGVGRGSDFARLMSAPPPQRVPLLARVLGGSVAEAETFLKQAQEKLDTSIAAVPPSPFEPWVAAPASSPSNGTNGPVRPPDTPPASPPDPAVGSRPSGPIQGVSVVQQEHTPAPPPRRIKFRVQVTPTTSAPPKPQTRITDAARCQEVILHFEEAMGRFPLPVSQLQGERAYGCDVLSFEAAALRDQFKAQTKNPEAALVSRFIEVKGKSSENSTIELRGNELHAAERVWTEVPSVPCL